MKKQARILLITGIPFNHMNLVVSIEEEFDIQFDNMDIVEMLNFKLIVEIIKKNYK